MRKRPTIFTTNKALQDWGRVLHDPDLAQAIIDRVLERGRLFQLDGPSMRTRHLGLDDTPPQEAPSPPSRTSGIATAEFPEPTTSTQELSYRLALSIASYLDSEASARLKTFDQARDLYTVRSKLVHGEKLADDEEAAAIQLAEHYVPEAEEFTRKCISKIFTDRIDNFVATTKQLDRFYTLLVTGHDLSDALKTLGTVPSSRT